MDDSSFTGEPSPSRLDARLIERTEAIPATPSAGNYVVVDTLHFSNTVIELLANGAAYVHITDERGEEFAYRDENPRARIGGGRTEAYEPEAGYDFYNSPSYIQDVDVDARPVSMTSTNGGRAVAALREAGTPEVNVYVGSTMNAASLGTYLQKREEPTYIVSSGSKGEIAVEDHVGATLISKHLDGIPVSRTELELYRRQLKTAKGVDYVDSHERRRRDVVDYAMNINSRGIIPKLEGDALYDVTEAGGSDAVV